MDIPQFYEDDEERIRASTEGILKELWTAMPVSVVEDSDGKTVKLQPVIKGRIRDNEGKITYVDLPQLDTVPVHFPGGGADDKGKGGFTMTHPVKKGDEGIAIFSSRPIDNWFEKGGTQEPVDRRRHHLSDAKFIPGIRSKPRELKNVSTKTVQLRSDDEGDDKKPKHLIDIDHANGTITHSVDSGKHVTTVDKESGISHSVEHGAVHIQITKNGIKSKGTWNHDGGLKATETIQSATGLTGPLLSGAPGSPSPVGDVS